jgi:hypothetical protein
VDDPNVGVPPNDIPPEASTVQATTGASDNGNGINFYNEKVMGAGTLTHATRIQGNQIRDVTGIPIFLRSNAADLAGTSRLEATVLNNIVEEVKTGNGTTIAGTISAVYCQVACGGIPDNAKMGLNFRNNDFDLRTTTGGAESNTFLFDQCSADGYYYFPGYVGGQTNSLALSNYLAGAPYSNTMYNGQNPAVPGSFVYLNAFANNEAFSILPVPLYAAHSPSENFKPVAVSQFQVDALLKAALKRFETSGVSTQDLEKLRKVTISVSDMPVLFLGSSENEDILIDLNAAGFGWFIDETPDDDSEFDTYNKSVSIKAAGRMDLLTVIMHELGHHIGLRDDVPDGNNSDLMEGSLETGERRLPTKQSFHPMLYTSGATKNKK